MEAIRAICANCGRESVKNSTEQAWSCKGQTLTSMKRVDFLKLSKILSKIYVINLRMSRVVHMDDVAQTYRGLPKKEPPSKMAYLVNNAINI